MYAFRIAYDGRDYHGFQRQPDVSTIEATVFDALTALDITTPPPQYAAAGRTDAGVSAIAQTIGFKAPTWLTPPALNAELPSDIRAWAHTPVEDGFHATHEATNRQYTYFLHAPSASLDRATAAMAALSGHHDFRNLTPATDGTERTLTGSVRRSDPFLVMTVEANGFVHELVRRIASLIHRVATGAAPIEFIDEVLTAPSLDGAKGIPPAPPAPLVLTDVTYPDLTFATDSATIPDVVTAFESRKTTAETTVAVMETIIDGITNSDSS